MERDEDFFADEETDAVPECCIVNNDSLYWRNKNGKLTYVANFYFNLSEVINSASVEKYKVNVYTIIHDRICEVHTGYYSFDEFKKLDFFKLNRHLVIATGNRSIKYLHHFFQQQASQLEEGNSYYIDKIGEFTFDGKPYYCMGNRVLPEGASTKNFIVDENLKRRFRLDVDESLTPQEAFHGMLKFFDINHGKTDIMMVNSVIGHIRTFLKRNAIPTNYTLFASGETQTKKTTSLQFSSSMYNRLDGMQFSTIRTDTSLPYAEKMGEEFCDTVVIYDDLFKDACKRNENDMHAQGIIREVADNTPRYTINGGRQPNAHFAMTSESWLENISDLGRTWLIYFNDSLDENRLHECQERPLDIPTFMRDFISWVYSNHDKVAQSLKQEWSRFRKEQLNMKSRYRRLDSVEFTLQVVFDLILEYGVEINAITEEEGMKRMHEFVESLCHGKQLQQMIMEDLESKEASFNINYAKAFVDCIEDHIIDFGYEGDACFVHAVKGTKCIYIRSEYLTDTLNFQYTQHHTIKFYTKYFAEKNLLYRNSSSNVVKYDGVCYMAIRIDRLKLEVCSDDYKIEKLFRERRR